MEMLPMIRFSPSRKPVRIFPQPTDQGVKPLVPLIDIAVGIGVHRNHLFRVVKRNPKLFEGWVQPVTVTVTGSRRRNQDILCATREGTIACLVKVSYDRIKDPVAQERIIAFQRWAICALTAIIEGRAPDQPYDLTDCITLPAGRLRAAAVRHLSQTTGLKKTAIYQRILNARKVAGLPPARLPRAGQPKNRDAYATAHTYWREHPMASPKTLIAETRVTVSYCTMTRWVRAWRGRTRAALAEQRLFAPITPSPQLAA